MRAAEIGRVLKERLASLTFSPAIPVAWPNRDFTPADDRYLMAQIVRGDAERIGIKARARFVGSLIVTVVSKAGVGSGEGDGIADAVAAHFPADLMLGDLRITAKPSVRDGFQDAGFWHTPVTIPFEVLD